MIQRYYSKAHRRRLGGVAAFLPTDLSDLFWWTRAGFGVTESGGDVSQVQDFGSANLPQVQSVGLDKPTLVTNVINGHPVIRYDGIDHRMTAGVASDWTFLHDGSDYTMFIVCQTTDANPDSVFTLLSTLELGGIATNGMIIYYDDRSASSKNDVLVHQMRKANGTNIISTITSDNAYPAQTFGIIEVVYDRGIAGDDDKIYVDGVLKASSDELALPDSADPTDTLHIGSTINDIFLFKGDFAEKLIFKRALPDVERAQMRDYLNNKFAL